MIQIILSIFLLSATHSTVFAAIGFEDVSEKSGINKTLPTAASAWGDVNNDGWPDLWVSNHHMKEPSLYLNQQNGIFIDVAADKLIGEPRADFHGAAWADFDNDGDLDLCVITGGGAGRGSSPNHLFVNQGGILRDEASRLGIDYPLGRGRTPLWFDADRDGKLDIVLMNCFRPGGKAPSAIFLQTAKGFTPNNDNFGFNPSGTRPRLEKVNDLISNMMHLRNRKGPGEIMISNEFVQLADLSGDHYPDLVAYVKPMRVYSTLNVPYEEITNDIGFPNIKQIKDIAIEDFDSDGHMDIFMVRARSCSNITQLEPLKLRGRIKGGKGGDLNAVHFRSKSDITFNIYAPWADPSDPQKQLPVVFAKTLPPMPADGKSFTLSPIDSKLQHTDNLPEKRVTIEYDIKEGKWILRSSLPAINFIASSTKPIDKVKSIGFNPSKGNMPDDLLIKGSDRFESSTSSGISGRSTACHSLAAGDFDNDMDIDLYLVCSGPTQNLPNVLYENDGTGHFLEIPNAGGASGSIEGIGNQVVSADYDRDGFLDLFVTNGAGPPPFSNDGPHQLFHNRGNTNHWLEIDLQGTLSNRDGIGSVVELEAGGMIQLRNQNGGIHSFSQNHQRIHFGLGQNTKIDRITIRWTNGTVQEIKNVVVDQILKIIEPSST